MRLQKLVHHHAAGATLRLQGACTAIALTARNAGWRAALGPVLLASMVGVAGPAKGQPQDEPPVKEESRAAAEVAKSGQADESDASTWIDRARQAAATMQEKVADEKLIFQSLISRALVRNGQTEEATKLALSLDPLTRVNALLSIAGIQADEEDPESVKRTLSLVRRELASMKRKDPQTYGMGAASWIRSIIGGQSAMGDFAGARQTLSLLTPDLDKGSLHFTDAGPFETPPGAYKSDALANIATNQVLLRKAREARKTASSIPIKGTREAALWMVAEVLASQGHLKESGSLTKELIASLPTDSKAIVFSDGEPLQIPVSVFASNALGVIAMAHAAVGNSSEADAVLKSIPREDARAEAIQEIAGARSREGRFPEAKEMVKGIPSRAARESILVEIGMEQARQGDLAGAKETSNEITGKKFRALIHGTIGEVLLSAGKEDDATDMFSTAEKLVEDEDVSMQLSVLLRTASVYSSGGQRDTGHARIERALILCEKIEDEAVREQSYLRIAEHQLKLKELGECKRILARIRDQSSRAQTVILLGVHEHMAGREKEARETFREAFQLALSIDLLLWIEDPRSKAHILRVLGRQLAKLGELELVSQFAEGAKATHSRAPAYLFLGAAEGLMEMKGEPRDASEYTSRAGARAENGDYEKALADYAEALRLDPEYIRAYNGRIIAWIRLEEFDKAIADLGKAIQRAPENPYFLNVRAWLCATCEKESCRDGRQAVADATKACVLTDWKDPKYIDTLAAAYAESGSFEEAVKWQRKAVELAPAEMKAEFSSRIELYQGGKAYRENPNE